MSRLKIDWFHFAGLLLILQMPGHPLKAQSWDLVRDQDGIRIYTRKEAGKSLKSYQGIADIQAPSDKVFALIENVYDHDWWGKGLSQVKVLLYEKNKRSRYYLEYRLPWPLSNRDLFVEVKVNADTVNLVFRTMATPLPGVIPEYPGKVRMPAYRQSWTITPIGKASAHVILEGYADPAGNIPDWITNLAIVDTPINIIRGLKVLAEAR
ncbi:MAG: hypothetical protein WC699_05650 [Bacteroidales bacterium]|jgi:hypothetical protein